MVDTNPAEMLKAGDTLTIVLDDIPGGQQMLERQIKSDGTFVLVLEQMFHADGKTRTELEQDIHDRYVPDYYKRMSVNVRPQADTRLIYVGGEVRSSGGQRFIPGVTVSKAIESAGGFTDFAAKKRVKLIRSDGKHIVIVNCKKVLVDRV